MIQRSKDIPQFRSPEALVAYYRAQLKARDPRIPVILVCGGTGCRASRGQDVIEAFEKTLAKSDLAHGVTLRMTGCHGFCAQGPLVLLMPKGVLYVGVKVDDVPEIVRLSVQGDDVIERLTYKVPGQKKHIPLEADIPFYANQERTVLSGSGRLNPNRIDEYIAAGGYQALKKALTEMTPDEIIDAVDQAGLRGRGGGGFATARKWRACRKSETSPKYVICNGDEGDPGAFMDRSLMEGNPHSVLEGMAIGAYAIGAEHGYIYVRLEYPLAVENLLIAIEQARACGCLGQNILGTDFCFDVQISRGAGAFICGESTALMASIEGFAGEPRAKHIHTSEKGVFGKPTNLNNVETWANVPLIVNRGASWFTDMGSDNSKGTKIFSVVGKVKNTGLVEVAMGKTLRHIIFDVCGGVPEGRTFKGVQTGGPSGGCLPESHLDLPVDFDRLTDAGSMMGSGGMIVLDDHSCVVELARYYTAFLAKESCGKCTACREGVLQMLAILEQITAGQASLEDLGLLEQLCHYVKDNSICGLGKSAANPTLSTIRYFRDEYLEHIEGRRCRAGICRPLTQFVILDKPCKACSKCIKTCPVGAISGQRKQTHRIDQSICIQCGACREACPFNAIETEKPLAVQS